MNKPIGEFKVGSHIRGTTNLEIDGVVISILPQIQEDGVVKDIPHVIWMDKTGVRFASKLSDLIVCY